MEAPGAHLRPDKLRNRVKGAQSGAADEDWVSRVSKFDPP